MYAMLNVTFYLNEFIAKSLQIASFFFIFIALSLGFYAILRKFCMIDLIKSSVKLHLFSHGFNFDSTPVTSVKLLFNDHWLQRDSYKNSKRFRFDCIQMKKKNQIEIFGIAQIKSAFSKRVY